MTNDESFERIMQAVNGNMVDDGETAIELASVLIRRRYNEEFLKAQQPLSARDDGEFWLVEGPPDALEAKSGVGPIHVRLKKSDACVTALFCSLSEKLEKRMWSKGRPPFPKNDGSAYTFLLSR